MFAFEIQHSRRKRCKIITILSTVLHLNYQSSTCAKLKSLSKSASKTRGVLIIHIISVSLYNYRVGSKEMILIFESNLRVSAYRESIKLGLTYNVGFNPFNYISILGVIVQFSLNTMFTIDSIKNTWNFQKTSNVIDNLV